MEQIYVEATYIEIDENCVYQTSCFYENLFVYILLAEKELGKMEPTTKQLVHTSTPTPLGKTKAGRKEWDYVHSDLIGKVVVIHSCESVRTQYGQAYVCRCSLEGEFMSVLFGGTVLVDQLSDILDELPVIARVTKPGAYYLLEDPETVPEPSNEEVPF